MDFHFLREAKLASEAHEFNDRADAEQSSPAMTTTAGDHVVGHERQLEHGADDHDDAEPAVAVDTTAAENGHTGADVAIDPSVEAVVDGANMDHDFTEEEIAAKIRRVQTHPDTLNVEEALRFLGTLDPVGRHRLVMIDPATADELERKARYLALGRARVETADDERRVAEALAGLRARRPTTTEARDVVALGDGTATSDDEVRANRAVVVDWLKEHAGRGCYYQVNEPSADSASKKATDRDIVKLRGCFVDIDPDKSKLGLDLDRPTFLRNFAIEQLKLDAIRTQMRNSICPPTLIIGSGGGIQALWIFAEPVDATPDNRVVFARIEAALQHLWPQVDPGVKDVSRVLRLPGSLHAKYASLGVTRLVGVYRAPDVPRLGFAELADALAPWMPAAPVPAGGKRPPDRKADRAAARATTAPTATDAVEVDVVEVDGAEAAAVVPIARATHEDVDTLVATITDPKEGLLNELKVAPGRLGRLWKKGPAFVAEGKDRSGSVMRWLLVKFMGAAGYTFSDVWAAAQAWPHSVGRNPWDERSLARNWLADTEAREAELARRDDRAAGREVRDDDGRIEVLDDPLAITVTMTRVVAGLAEQRGDGLDVVLQHGRLMTERVVSVAAVEGGDGGDHALIRTLGPAFGAILEACLQARIRPVKVADGEVTEVPVPGGWPKALTAHISKFPGELPVVMGVAEGPFIRTDGSMVTRRGHDRRTATWVLDDVDVDQVPAVVPKAMAEVALAELASLLAEFPFGGDDGSPEAALNLSAALCGILTAVLRPSLAAAPAFLLTAPTPGSGKSELSRLMCTFATGGHVPLMTTTSDPEEFRKRLDAALLAGPRCLVLDNVTGRLDGDGLAALLTSPIMRVRELGVSAVHEVSTRIFLVANGNNVSVRDDLCRRFIEVRLDPRMERPEQRTFSHDPVAEVRGDRGRWLRLVAILINGWRQSGAHAPGKPEGGLAGFDGWYDCCVRPLKWLGWPDPVATQDGLRQGDEELEALEALFRAMARIFGRYEFTAKSVVDLMRGVSPVADDGGGEGDHVEDDDEGHVAADAARAEAGVALREAIGRLIDESRLRGNANRAIGLLLNRYRGRVVGTLRLVECGTTGGRRRWRLARQ